MIRQMVPIILLALGLPNALGFSVPLVCRPDSCNRRGRCEETPWGVMEYNCHCDHGWTGSDCEHSTICFPNPCQNNGKCEPITMGHFSDYQCICPPGSPFSGKNCEIYVSSCHPPCQNGGQCFQNQCRCLSGFMGRSCEFRTPVTPQPSGNPCDHRPCQNGGICHDRPSWPEGYFCNCKYDWGGERCETWVGRPFECATRSNGNFQDPFQCPAPHFYQCAGSQGWLSRCGTNLFYNVQTDACTYRNNVKC